MGIEHLGLDKEAESKWRTKDEFIVASLTDRKTEEIQYGKPFPDIFPADKARHLQFLGEDVAISGINEHPKYSTGYYSCIGCVVIGKTKAGKNISLMTHQLGMEQGKTKQEFKQDLEHFLSQVEPGTVDAVLFGGEFDMSYKKWREDPAPLYIRQIESSASIMRDVLGFDPTVLAGPASGSYRYVDAAVDTETRRMWIIRPAQQPEVAPWSFPARQVREVLRNATNQKT